MDTSGYTSIAAMEDVLISSLLYYTICHRQCALIHKYGLKICILFKGVYYMNSYTVEICVHEMA